MNPLIGTWFISGISSDEEGILVITPEGRAVQFPTSKAAPRINEIMRLWWSEDASNSIRFRPSPFADGWLREVEISGPHWTMMAVKDGIDFRFPCRHASREFLPPWFDDLLDRNLLLMTGQEQQPEATDGSPEG